MRGAFLWVFFLSKGLEDLCLTTWISGHLPGHFWATWATRKGIFWSMAAYCELSCKWLKY